MVKNLIYDSREHNDGYMRKLEFHVYNDGKGELTLEFDKILNELNDKLSYPDLGNCGEQIFMGSNWNLRRTSDLNFKKVPIVLYSNPTDQGRSIYPAECFRFVSTTKFLEQVKDFFDYVWKNFPEKTGPISGQKTFVLKQTTTSTDTKTKIETTTERKTMNIDFNKIGKDIVTDNVEFARFEAERKIGQTALDISVDAFCKQFPSFQNVADTGVGKLAIANLVRVLGNHYKGGNKNAVDMFTTAVMRGAYANAGDSIDLDAMLDGVVGKFKNLVPSMIDVKEK